jgi:exopolyphosphatase/guanosine-5'-triphosphate,3'-diphosphate pyrophosphatase
MGNNSDPVAAIGIGSNSVRLLIVGRSEHGEHAQAMERREQVTRLAGYSMAGYERLLEAKSVEETLRAALGFARHAQERGANLVGVIATEAVRASSNRDELTSRLEEELGLPITVISGEEEARLGWFAVTASEDNLDNGATLGVVDIGGGSTDLSVGYAGVEVPESVVSIQVGSRTAMRRFDLHRAVELTKLWGILSSVAIETSPQLSSLEPKPGAAIVIGGTAEVLAGVYNAQEGTDSAERVLIERDWLARWLSRMALVGQEGRVAQGVPADRADVIVAGGVILLSLLEAWGLRQFSVSKRNILDGFIRQLGK